MELSNIIRIEHFKTLNDYAKTSGLSRATGYNRVRAGHVATIKIDGKILVDTSQISGADRFYTQRSKSRWLRPVMLPPRY